MDGVIFAIVFFLGSVLGALSRDLLDWALERRVRERLAKALEEKELIDSYKVK